MFCCCAWFRGRHRQTDVGIPIIADNETAKVHVAMWLERVPEEELKGNGPPHTHHKIVTGPDLGFNVRSVEVEEKDTQQWHDDSHEDFDIHTAY